MALLRSPKIEPGVAFKTYVAIICSIDGKGSEFRPHRQSLQPSESGLGGHNEATRVSSPLRWYLPSALRVHINGGRALLALAVVAGMALRFHRLDGVSMTADEGAAWAAAAQPVRRLLQLQPQLDAGKLAIYDLLLHYWIDIFGDSLRSMRSLSAAIDAISILLMFALVRELYQVFADGDLKSGELAGGFAALLFATDVAVMQTARTARMYPLMTAAELAQIVFFLRALHREAIFNCIVTAGFLALAIAVNFTAMFLLAGEGIWIAYLLVARRRRWPGERLRVLGPSLSLIAGIALLLPFAPAGIATSRAAMAHGALDWIGYRPPLGWSYDVLRNGPGNRFLFRLLLALAAFSLWRHRSRAPMVPMFMAVVTVGPFVAVAILSLFGRPMMVDRYVLLALIAFLALAATGAAAFESILARIVVLLLIGWLSTRALRHSSGFWVDWKDAVAIACAHSAANAGISVAPGYAVDVVRYHLPVQRRPLAVAVDSHCGASEILIISPGRPLEPAYMSTLNACYPRLLGRATRVEVRAR
jgi:Dolichyl-phosphate-mannose-protein mannosyltransferase